MIAALKEEFITKLAIITTNIPRKNHRIHIFVYDMLMDMELMKQIHVYPKRSTLAFLNDHDIASSQGTDGVSGSITVFKKQRAKVYGIIHDIDESELTTTDKIAQESGFIRNQTTVIDVSGHEKEAYVYVAKNHSNNAKCPSKYILSLIEFAEQAGLPPPYIARLSSLSSEVD